MPPDPPRKFAPLVLEKQAATYFPSGNVYFKTYFVVLALECVCSGDGKEPATAKSKGMPCILI